MINSLVGILLAFLVSTSLQSDPQVELKSGKVSGSSEKINDVVIHRFLGIPYAEPPIGNLRFKKPKPWTPISKNTLNDNQWPKVCPQPDVIAMVFGHPHFATTSEDCLYLNIWTPVDPKELINESSLRPVLVFIHGGGLFVGSSSHPLYDGSKLAAHGDLLVVTINYRLGILGFLYGNDESAPGNMGLWDQLLALEWIQDNIKYFGGDPRKVTVSGESAGSWSISLHLTSQPTEHLFDKAFLMSGVAIDGFPSISKAEAIQRTLVFAELVGCRMPGGDSDIELTQDEVDCLQQVDTDEIMKAQSHPSLNVNPLTFVSIFGDTLLPKSPVKAISSHNLRNRKVLIGTTVNEGSVFTSMTPSFNANENMSVNEAIDKVSTALQIINGPNNGMSKAMIESIYFQSTDLTLREQYLNAMSDILFNCPTSLLAEKLSKDNQVHQYLFAAKSNKSMICKTEDLRPCHADDLYFVFGNMISSEEDKELSEAWMDTVIAFIKDEPMAWPKFEHFGKRNTAPYYVFRGKEGNEIRQGFRHFECQFWNDLYE